MDLIRKYTSFIMSNYKILFFLSLFMIVLGFAIFLIGNLSKTQEDELYQISRNEVDCLVKILYKEEIFLNIKGQLVNKNQCRNLVSPLPIMKLSEYHNYESHLKYLLNSLIKIGNTNPTIFNGISEIFFDGKKLQFFLDFNKIRVDVKDYAKKNWEEKFISLVIWLYNQKNIKKGFLELTEKDSLLIVNGEL